MPHRRRRRVEVGARARTKGSTSRCLAGAAEMGRAAKTGGGAHQQEMLTALPRSASTNTCATPVRQRHSWRRCCKGTRASSAPRCRPTSPPGGRAPPARASASSPPTSSRSPCPPLLLSRIGLPLPPCLLHAVAWQKYASRREEEAFLRFVWAGRQNACCVWVNRWSLISIGKSTVGDVFLGLGSLLDSVSHFFYCRSSPQIRTFKFIPICNDTENPPIIPHKRSHVETSPGEACWDLRSRRVAGTRLAMLCRIIERGATLIDCLGEEARKSLQKEMRE